MKKLLPAFLFFTFSIAAFAQQQLTVKKPNFTTFPEDAKLITSTLAEKSSPAARQHPEYGILPFNSRCSECVELIDKRTVNTRLMIKPNRAGYTWSQKSYFPLHYKKSENDIWRTIDFRLRPVASQPNVFAANNQPVPTKCDLNKKTTSLTESGFEFEYNKNLTLFFFDEATVYTQKQLGNYSDHTIGQEGLHVKNMWSGIDMQQEFRMGEIKTSYVIKAPLQLPSAKGYMVIEDHFTLPEGFTFTEKSNGTHVDNNYYRGDYELKNAEGKLLITYEKPVYFDTKVWGMHGMYNLLRTGNDYTLQTLVPVEWLNNPDNIYPLTIDPIVLGQTKMGDFVKTGQPSANFGFTDMNLGSCDFYMNVNIPGMSDVRNTYIDLEYTLTYDNMCGSPPLPPPFCTFSQVSMEVQSDECGTTTGLLACDPAQPPFTGTCTSDSNLVPAARSVFMPPSYMNCIPPQCPDYQVNYTLKNRDSICGDQCGYLCARGNIWIMTVEACQVEGDFIQDKTEVCIGESVTFTARPVCGVPPYHFVWSTDGGTTFDTVYGTTTYTITPTVTTYVSCIIYDDCENFHLPDPSDLTVTVVASPPADAGPDVHLCTGGGTVNIGGNPTTSPGTAILWTGENSTVQSYLNANIPNPTVTIPNGTIDTFYYVLRASLPACFRNDTVYVFSSPPPFADAGADITMCAGETATLGGNPTTNGAAVLWTSDNSTAQSWISNPTDRNPQVAVPAGSVGTFYYAVTANTADCVETDTITVVSNPAPIIDAGPANINLCEGGTIALGGNPTMIGGTSILWGGETASVESWISDITAANPQATIPAGTVDTFFYTLFVDDPLCPRRDTVNVISHPNPIALIDTNGSTKICANQTVTLSVVGSYASYAWSNGSSASSVTVNQSGPYSATVTDAFGCTAVSNVIAVSTIPIPSIQVFPDTLITYGDSVTLYTDIQLSAASLDSFAWYPAVNISCINCDNPVVTPQNASQYYGINIYAGGCTATDSALIRVIFPNNFFIPNAFTPTGDGNNDNFYIQAQSGVKVLLFQVFNRWGEKVHEGSYPWDGTYKGKPSPAGVYVYLFKLGLFGDEQSVFRKGTVTLFR